MSATITITRGTSLPNSATKTDFHNLIDTATGVLSGTLTTSDLSASAGIVGTQLSASADILDTQLHQITTASKVHGSSLTGLASTPSGAGVIPIANLASGTPTGSKYIRDDGTLQTVSVAAVSGMVIQMVNSTSSGVATGTTVMVDDDTIPQNTEGDEYMSKAITPTNASNLLRIDVVFNGSSSADTHLAVALFQDSTASALAAVIATQGGAGYRENLHLTHWMAAGTTSSTTFKVRAGGVNAGTTTFNGNGSARKFGGVMASSITITEIKA